VMWFNNLPGRIVASNITPDPETGAGNWTDDQLARAIREGIGHDGRALFPMMPYENLRHMSDEDLASLVVYIRSLPAVRHELPASEIVFPVKYLILRYRNRLRSRSAVAANVTRRVFVDSNMAADSWKAPGAERRPPISLRMRPVSATRTRRCLHRRCGPDW
jgi:hypothetical protein